MQFESTYAPRVPVNLRATLGPVGRGAFDPTFRWAGADAWLTMRTAAGAATLHLQQGAAIAARAWGPAAELAIAGVPALLGADDDWSALDVRGHCLLHETWRRMPGLRLARTGRLFAALVPSIIEQKVTSIEALRSWRRLATKFGDVAPGPVPDGMRVIPSADAWRRIPSWEWHTAGVGLNRAEAVVRAASIASALERGVRMEAADAARRLRTVRGIGVWTAAETVQRSHGAPDHISIGDYHLASFVGWALVGAPVDDDGMLELLEPWTGHRQRVVRLLVASGFRKPAFGPRMTIQDHRGH
jgi:3-methyladenine DNA glycosylase/8-oxoguanine DNA glycosylase